VEFEVPARQAVALQDSDGFTVLLEQAAAPVQPGGCALYFQVTADGTRLLRTLPLAPVVASALTYSSETRRGETETMLRAVAAHELDPFAAADRLLGRGTDRA
jgi:hypothetical protein